MNQPANHVGFAIRAIRAGARSRVFRTAAAQIAPRKSFLPTSMPKWRTMA